MLLETSESSLPPAPWEDGVCKVCGMDKDDDSVLLCDKCDSEYHTYCLDPPLARIPEGNWYCPSCISSQSVSQDERCGTRALCRLRGKKKLRKEFTRSILETLALLADTMELMEYWELGIEERVFLFKFLCDEALSSGIVRNHLGPDSADLEKKLRKLYKELKNQNKKEESPAANLAKETKDKCQEEYWSFSKPSNSQSQTENEENDENRHVGSTKSGQDQETVSQFKNRVSSLQEKITTLESKIAKPVIRREFLGRDLVGRLYWAFTGPDRVVVSGPQSRGKACASLKECEMTEMPEMYTSDYSLWTSYESDVEIQELVGWLRDDDPREKELKDTIKQWQRNRRNDDNSPQNGVESVQDNPLSSSAYGTKARAVLEKKFGSFLEHGAIQYLKKQGRKGKMVNPGKWYRCDCLELIGPTRHHCPSCHFTFLTLEELKGHNDGKCENRQEFEGPSKNKKTPLVKQLVLTDHRDEPESPFVFEEIRAKFCTRSSLKEEVKDIGLIGSNGIPSFICKVPPQNFNDALLLVSETKNWINLHDGPADFQILEKHGANETPSKVERLKPKGISGKSSLKNRSAVRICQSSLKPLSGRVLEIIRCLKINLFDIETALPKEALRPSRGGLDRIRAWWAFVKSAQSIYEMVQATLILEDMITTEYLRKEWWYWSSPSTAAKISTISALSLRIYTLDAAIYYEKPPPSNQDPTEPVTPKSSKSEKKNPEKSNTKDSSEKSNPKNNLKSNADSKPAEASRPKTRSKKRARDSDS